MAPKRNGHDSSTQKDNQPPAKKKQADKQDDHAQKKKKTRITKEQKFRLWQYFDKVNWALQTAFPRKNGDKELDKELESIGLADSRDKASRQLVNWKNAKYFHANLVMEFDFEMALKCVKSHMEGKSYKTFVDEVIQRMLGEKDIDNTHYKTTRLYARQRKGGKELLKFVQKTDSLMEFFVKVIKFYEEMLAKLLPKQFNMMSAANLLFSEARSDVSTDKDNLAHAFYLVSITADLLSFLRLQRMGGCFACSKRRCQRPIHPRCSVNINK